MNLSSDPINTLENLIAKNKTKSISIFFLTTTSTMQFARLWQQATCRTPLCFLGTDAELLDDQQKFPFHYYFD